VPADVPPHPAPRRQQVWEIPPGVPVITEYQYHTVTCPDCQAAVTAERPADVPPGAFGPRVIALIAMLHGRYRLSTRELVSLLQMLWGVPISVGGIARAQHVASQALAPADAEVQQAVTRAAHANVDETRWREATRKCRAGKIGRGGAGRRGGSTGWCSRGRTGSGLGCTGILGIRPGGRGWFLGRCRTTGG